MEYGLVVLWLLAFAVLAALSFPLSTWLFGDLPGAPAALAAPLGLAVVTVVGHLVGHVAFGLPAALAGLLVLVGLSALAYREVDLSADRVPAAAVVFLLAFGLMTWIRALDPAAAVLPLAIGEKFLDYGLLATLERTSTLPPEDMWFAGEAIQYHYGGHLATSLFSTLTGTPPRFAYNLGLAAFYAMLVTAAFGLAGAIAAHHDANRYLGGGLGAFFVGVAGNFHTTVAYVGGALPDALAGWLLTLVGRAGTNADWRPRDFYYFDASRVIPTDGSDPNSFMAATEFPLFAWLNGDLHAHMMVQPFVLLIATVLVAYWLAAGDRRRRLVLLFGALPPLIGLVGITNVWSFPTVLGLTVLSIAAAPGEPLSVEPLRDRAGISTDGSVLRREALRLLEGGLSAVAVALLGILWTLPFWLGVVAGGPSRTVEYFAPWSPLGGLFVHLAPFLLGAVPIVAARGLVDSDNAALDLGVVLGPAIAAAALGAAGLALFGPLIAVGWYLQRTREDVGYATVLIVAAAGLALLVEFVTIPGERFNVIFKPYVEVWLFFAVGTAVLFARGVDGWPLASRRPDASTWRLAVGVLLAVSVVGASTYAMFALPAHANRASPTANAEGPTLDATAFLEVEYPREAAAIRWLQDREGRPTIVTGVEAGYRWNPDDGKGASAPASLTGLPTVLGWFHEAQYRGRDVYNQRRVDVDTIYTGSAAQQRQLLDKYDVTYVYVGPAERSNYGTITVGSLAATSVAREWPAVTIYRVDQSQLPAGG